MVSHRDDATKAMKYFRDAADLRVAIQLSLDDFEFSSKQRGQIVYVFDTNVVRLFLNPAAQHASVDVFRESDAGGHAGAIAGITAEWLFSRRLAGQEGLPPFITLKHGEEVGAWLAKVVNELRENDTTRDGPAVDTEAWAQLKELAAGVERKNKANRRAMLALIDELPRVLGDEMSADRLSEAIQFARLCAEDRLRPLSLCEHADGTVLAPEPTSVAAWAARIARARQPLDRRNKRLGRARNREDSSGKTSLVQERDRNDGYSLAQVMAMNRAVAGCEPPVQCVLVTADRAIHGAYAEWYFDANETSAAGPYCVRQAFQYAPMLNMQEIPYGDTNSRLSAWIRDALDGLFSFFLRQHESYPYILSCLTGPLNKKYEDAASFGELFEYPWQEKLWRALFYNEEAVEKRAQPVKLDEIIKEWRAAERTCLLVKADIIQPRISAESGALLKAISCASTEGGMAWWNAYLEEVITQVDNAHVALGIKEVVGYVDALVVSGEPASINSDRVRYLRWCVRADFSEFLASFSSISDLVGELHGKNEQSEFWRRLQVRLEADDKWFAMFFIVWLCVLMGLWEVAVHYGRRAIEEVKRRTQAASGHEREWLLTQQYELAYTVAVAMRLSLSDEGRLKEARDILDASLARFAATGDDLGSARTESEYLALSLTVKYIDAANKDGGWAAKVRPETSLDEMAGRLKRGLKSLKKLRYNDGGDAACAVKVQLLANAVSLSVIGVLSAEKPTATAAIGRRLEALEVALKNKGEKINLSPVGQIVNGVAAILTSTNEAEKADSRKRLRKQLDDFDRSLSPAIAPTDRKQAAYLRACIASGLI